MQFHLGFKPRAGKQNIYHNDHVLMIGSCFSEHIGAKMNALKFNVHSNPFGIVFNPQSIESALTRILDKHYYNEIDVFEKEGLWYNLDAHSSIVATKQSDLLHQLNTTIDQWNQYICDSKFLIITLGSAYAYKHKEQNKIVANCHKLPPNVFEKVMLETQTITSSFQKVIDRIIQINPQLGIFFTVSPVKHLRDGVVENSLSKSILIQTVHQLINANSNCSYFPAYELVTDDLRDYRFYEADMAHPNKQAIDYVWQKFSECYFNEETISLNEKLNEINQALQHRPFNSSSESHLKFKKNFLEKCKDLNAKYPNFDLEKELNYFAH